MLDLNPKFGRKVKRRLKKEQEIWLTTTDANGTPQPRPVWFQRVITLSARCTLSVMTRWVGR